MRNEIKLILTRLETVRDKVEEYADAAEEREGKTINANLLVALEELMEQLTGIGIAIDGEDTGQWHGTEGLSFSQTRTAITKARRGKCTEHTAD